MILRWIRREGVCCVKGREGCHTRSNLIELSLEEAVLGYRSVVGVEGRECGGCGLVWTKTLITASAL